MEHKTKSATDRREKRRKENTVRIPAETGRLCKDGETEGNEGGE